MRKLKTLFTGLLLSLSALALAQKPASVSDSDNSNAQLAKYLDVYNSIFKQLSLYYVDTINAKKIISSSIDEALSSLDPYTTYIPDEESSDFKFMTTGQYGGIGALISQHPRSYSDSLKSDYDVLISEPYEGLPADKAGLKAGDVIVQIDKTKVKGKTISEVSEMLRGIPGTSLEVIINRGGEKNIKKHIVREKIAIPAVTYYGVVGDSTAYILLSQFTEKSAEGVRTAINDMKSKHKITSIVLDLRNNPGGLLDQAVEIINLFVPQGKEVLSMRGRAKQLDQVFKTSSAALLPDIPLAVLVNSSSASASEIVSGALQDLDRAVVIGTRSFGKGLVQSTRELPYNGHLKLTTAKYYIPSGRCIQAIDYAKRADDGSLSKIPDSLRHEFKTANGRVVKDGGGIEPDFEVKNEMSLNIAYQLWAKNLIFDYATMYCSENKRIAEPESFSITDKDFEAFKSFVKGTDFKYELRTSGRLEWLLDIAKEEGYGERAKDEFAALKKKLTPDIDADMDLFKKDIVDMINGEILKRMYYQKGYVRHTLVSDPVLKKALSVLNDKELYTKTLSSKK
ncbi:MAG: S41 family peptidase [Paludibacteraceae bacterium]|nr:S41 family peptidase [Paludibacteraceae bacterium]MBR0498778.1 S41 family peptidase [Paludibacteraceae bacterium]